ncbi:MAG: phosphatidate cytidylyltransferase [Planctomycetes bacterium]|nr:phosphatidate cytidylyltransferase [Planctomycetota bacterium]
MTSTRLRIGVPLLGSVLALLALDHAYASDLGFTFLIALFVAGGLAEFYTMMTPGWGRLPTALGVTAGVLLVLFNWVEVNWAGGRDVPWTMLLLFLVVGGAFTQHMTVSEPGTVPRLFVLVFGLIYIWLPLSFALRLRDFDPHAWATALPPVIDPRALGAAAGKAVAATARAALPAPGEALCLFVVLVSKMTDTGAYFAGKTFGRIKLAPVISPGKTVEGAVGGLAAAWLVGWAIWANSPLFVHYSFPAMLVLATVVSIAGQVGDLSESLVKRYAKVKDSGTLLPAFGGVLDLLDSFLASVPAAYLCVLALPTRS